MQTTAGLPAARTRDGTRLQEALAIWSPWTEPRLQLPATSRRVVDNRGRQPNHMDIDIIILARDNNINLKVKNGSRVDSAGQAKVPTYSPAQWADGGLDRMGPVFSAYRFWEYLDTCNRGRVPYL